MKECVIALMFLLLASGFAESSHRKKRNVFQFADMVNCVTGRWPLFSYGNYGCYCGFGGQGEPVDEIDRCCEIHDGCYNSLIANETCGPLQTYIIAYSYHTSNCYSDEATVYCGPDDDKCASAMCECDRDVTTCFKENDDSFNEEYIFYDTWWLPRC